MVFGNAITIFFEVFKFSLINEQVLIWSAFEANKSSTHFSEESFSSFHPNTVYQIEIGPCLFSFSAVSQADFGAEFLQYVEFVSAWFL